MKIKNLFYCADKWFGEYANKLADYCYSNNIDDFYYYCSNRALFSRIPKEKMISLNDIKKGNVEIENVYGNYFLFTSGYKGFKDSTFHKISYGLGNDDAFYSRCKWGNEKRTKEYLGCCDYETHKFFTRKNNQIEKFRTLGLLKYDQTIPYNRQIEINKINIQQNGIDDNFFDSKKPTILFLHTYPKDKPINANSKELYHQGLSNYLETANQLDKISNEFNIIHKNHHMTDNAFSNFLNISNGSVDSKFLIDIADIIIAEYGGSALEALISDKKIIYIDDYKHNEISKLNIDAKMHNLFDHCYPEDVLKHIDKETSKEEFEIRQKLRDYFFSESLNNPCERFIKYINNPDCDLFEEQKFLDKEITKMFNFGWKSIDIPKIR